MTINDVPFIAELTEDQKNTLNPLIPPTSGIRMILMDPDSTTNHMKIPRMRQDMFFRVFKAISEIAKQEIGKEW